VLPLPSGGRVGVECVSAGALSSPTQEAPVGITRVALHTFFAFEERFDAIRTAGAKSRDGHPTACGAVAGRWSGPEMPFCIGVSARDDSCRDCGHGAATLLLWAQLVSEVHIPPSSGGFFVPARPDGRAGHEPSIAYDHACTQGGFESLIGSRGSAAANRGEECEGDDDRPPMVKSV
jgi:hypothetical protein